MKRPVGKGKKITKGMPSAVLLSIVIHVALFLLAGMLVVFTVVKKEEKKFEPPKAVERPKMKLKKPKVKVKKTSRPKQTKHILTKVNPAKMPEIQLPEISGMGGDGGLGGGIGGGFDTMPDLEDVSVFGAGQSIGNDLVGTYYDSKLDRRGRKLSVDISGFEWRSLIRKFLKNDWRPSIFSRYYRSPKKLYATNFIVPLMPSSNASDAFDADESVSALWMAHYKGELVYPEAITFRFWGGADEFMAVRVDGEMVLGIDFSYEWESMGHSDGVMTRDEWESDSADSRKYDYGNFKNVVGDWITLEPGVAVPMEVLIGDNGYEFCFVLAVEVKGVEYERSRQGAPILPAFKTAEFSRDQLDVIYNLYPADEICLTNGPVFRDYDVAPKAAAHNPADEPSPAAEVLPLKDPAGHGSPLKQGKNEMRTWTLMDGRTVEAEFVISFGGKVVLKNAKGKTRKIPREELSAGDREYAELASPLKLDINFLKNFDQKTWSGGFYDYRVVWRRWPEKWGFVGVQLKQTSPGEYNHELQVELFAIGKQLFRSRAQYILLDHQKTAFIPSKEDRFYEFRSERVIKLTRWSRSTVPVNYGEEYAGYLVTVTDARGEIIAVKSSANWLEENLEDLKKLSVGNYFDKTCTRTFPVRPKNGKY